MLDRTIRKIYALMLLSIVIVSYITYATYQGLVDKKYTILAVERENAISKLQTEAAAITAQEGNSAEARKQINALVRDRRNWEPFIFNYYASVEIYPVNTRNYESLFESSLTGKYTEDDPKYLNTTSYTPELMLAKDHRKVWVYRVSALANIGLNNVTVNADIDVEELVKRYAERWLALVALLVVLGLIVRFARQLRGSVSYDTVMANTEDAEKVFARRILAAIENVESDLVIAEIDEETKETKILHATHGMHRRMGYRAGELIGRELEIFLPQDKKTKHQNEVWNFFITDDEISGRVVKAVNKDGSTNEVWLAVRKGQPVRGKRDLTASVRDVEQSDGRQGDGTT